jgi:photosystem II stability/assembly factor-like uncharacterized protein
MSVVVVAMQDALAILRNNGCWHLDERFTAHKPVCVAADNARPERLYCGTWNEGLWASDDAGLTWHAAGPGIRHTRIMAVAVSPIERPGAFGVVYAGTEPSALFRSEDGGATWVERPSLLDLPSRPTWSYPPRPKTHHVRWIEPDPIVAGRLFVAIEQGGVMRSLDGGLTWEDHKAGAQRDGHTLAAHPLAPGLVYEAAGGEGVTVCPELRMAWPPIRPLVRMSQGGFAVTHDGGDSWQTLHDGLDENAYVWGLAADPGEPETLVASAAIGPMHAHHYHRYESFLIRRERRGCWQRLTDGLPSPDGMGISVIGGEPGRAGVLYAANNRGVFRSADGGRRWQALDVAWPERFQEQHVQGLAVSP